MTGACEPLRLILDGECERFMRICEKRIMSGEELAEYEGFLSEHRASCPDCGLYWKTLGAVGSSLIDENDPRVAAAVDRAEARLRSKRSGRRVVFFTGAVAAAAVLVIGLIFPLLGDLSSDEPAPVVAGSDEAENGSEPGIVEGRRLRNGGDDALFELENGIHVGLSANGEIVPDDPDDEETVIGLLRGMVAVAVPEHRGLRFRVSTSEGDVVVKGTVFGVERTASETVLHVLRGLVEVVPTGGSGRAPESVAAGHSFDLIDWTKTEISEEASERISNMLDGSSSREGVVAGSSDGGEQAAAKIQEDGQPAGTGAGREGSARRRKGASNADGDGRTSIEELYRLARRCRIDGDWACAKERYLAIMEGYPDSDENRNAIIFLADVELDHLGRPDEAARLFLEYQRRVGSGPLVEEAAFGECRALEKLGDRDAERQALERFLKKFPSSVNAGTAMSRLSLLRGESGEETKK